MTTMEELAERLAAVENRLGVVESLRSMTDADVSALEAKVSANGRLLKAMSEVQSDHTRTLRDHSGKLDKLAEGQQAIVDLLNMLIRQDDDRRTGADGVDE